MDAKNEPNRPGEPLRDGPSLPPTGPTSPMGMTPRQPAPAPPQTVIIHSSGAFFAKLFAWGLGLALLLSLMFNIYSAAAYSEYFQTSTDMTEHFHSGEESASDKIAIIKIEGIILDGDGFVKKQIDAVTKDKKVKAVVLRVDSPGGAVSAADYMFHRLKELRKERKDMPLLVSMGSLAASGGYYVSMAVGDDQKTIYAEPTTMTGSIGVIMPRYDLSEVMKELHVKDDSIMSNPLKEMGSWTKELSPTERAKLQAQIDELFGRFKDIVKEGRPMFRKDEDALNQVATGEVFTAEQAKKLGLVDEIAFLEDVLDEAAKRAKLKKYRAVEFKQAFTLTAALTGNAQSRANPFDPKTLMEMTTPRCYYLYTWLPVIVAR